MAHTKLSIANTPFQKAIRLIKTPIFIAILVTPTRFSLELMGLPENAIFIVGLLWLTLALSVYWGYQLAKEAQAHLILLLSLLLFSPVSRLPVFILWWITKTWGLGTHYDIFDHWQQALIGQLFYGSLIQIIPGFILGAISIAFIQYRYSTK